MRSDEEYKRLAQVAYDAWAADIGYKCVAFDLLADETKQAWDRAVKAVDASSEPVNRGLPAGADVNEETVMKADFKLEQLVSVGGQFYRIAGVHLGGTSTVDMICLHTVQEKPGCAGGVTCYSMYVPRLVLEAALDGGEASLYDPVDIA